MIVKTILKKKTYRDSITLMRISNTVAELQGVSQAALLMATPVNIRLLRDLGLLTSKIKEAAPDDLIIALQTYDEEAMKTTVTEVERLLHKREDQEEEQILPKTLDSAFRLMPDANVVVISVPGRFAKREALAAIRRGLNVFIFSSQVSLEDEFELKKTAKQKGLLMMGPDCGTAIINNVALGFANILNQGSVGIVSASGTGLQQVSTLLDRNGLGISQAIGTGGNDLSDVVGGIMTAEGIKLLEEDEKTHVIILISKSPGPSACKKILRTVSGCRKPIIINFLGVGIDAAKRNGYIWADTLEDAATFASALIKEKKLKKTIFTSPRSIITALAKLESSKLIQSQRYVRGLFSGGTLCTESLSILTHLLGEVYSNTPLKYGVRNANISREHTCIDMGSEVFTAGRLHPIIDFTLRKRRIIQEAKDPETAVLLLDVILGVGANRDPAAELVPSILEAKNLAQENGRFLSVTASIIGTPRDPQRLPEQKRKLREAEVVLLPSNAQASRMAAIIASRGAVEQKIFGR